MQRNFVKALRTLRKEDQRRCAEAMGITQSVYSSFELGRREVSKKELRRLAAFLKVDAALLEEQRLQAEAVDA